MFGFVPGYVSEEGFANGHGSSCLTFSAASCRCLPGQPGFTSRLCLPCWHSWECASRFASELPAASGPRVMMQARQAVILGAVLLVALSPHYPWYLGWLAPLACLAPLPSVLWMLAAAPLLAHGAFEHLAVPGAVYVPAVVLAAMDMCRPPACATPSRTERAMTRRQGSAPLLRGRADARDAGDRAAGVPLSGGDQPLQPAVRDVSAHLRDARAAGGHELGAFYLDRRSGAGCRARRAARRRRADAGEGAAADDPLSEGSRRVCAVQHQWHAAVAEEAPGDDRYRAGRAARVARCGGCEDVSGSARARTSSIASCAMCAVSPSCSARPAPRRRACRCG